MQWRILNDDRAILVVACDKLASKALVENIAATLGTDIGIPRTLWIGTDARELQRIAERLPARWVFKPNHSSGRVRLVDSGAEPIDWVELIDAGDRWMQPDEQVRVLGHRGYDGPRRLLVAEERIGDGAAPPVDLRAQVFDGALRRMDYSIGFGTGAHRVCCYERNLVSRVAANIAGEIPPNEKTQIDAMAPAERDLVRSAVEAIGGSAEYLRVDGYFWAGRYWFGELTAYASSGLGPIGPELDKVAGELWHLPDLSTPDPREAEWRSYLDGTPRGSLQ